MIYMDHFIFAGKWLNEAAASLNQKFYDAKHQNENSGADWRGTKLHSNSLKLRVIVVLFLISSIVIVSTSTFFVLKWQEHELYISQYNSYTLLAMQTVESNLQRKSNAARTVAASISYAHPNVTQWPYVSSRGFTDAARLMLHVTGGSELIFSPIVQPYQAQNFTEFMNYYFDEVERFPPSPTGSRPIFGVQVDPITRAVQTFVDSTGESHWGSKYQILTPQLQLADTLSAASLSYLGFNYHSNYFVGGPIDVVLDCAGQATQFEEFYRSPPCGAVTGFVGEGTKIVNNLIVQPVFPASDKRNISGLVFLSINWLEMLSDVVPTDVTGLDFVLTMREEGVIKALTFTMVHGVPTFRGEGDLHEERLSKFKRTKILNLSDSLAPDSNGVIVATYPRQAFRDQYKTLLPRNATISVVGLILLTSIAFGVYDYFMKRESTHKQELLDTKRQFVRFISHEVRTPLNAVSMGLKLLENDFNEAIDELHKECEGIEDEEGEGGKEGEKDDDEQAHQRRCRGTSTDASTGALVKKGTLQRARNRSSSSIGIKRRAERRNAQIQARRVKLEEWLQLSSDINANTASAVFVLDDLLNYDKVETGSLRLEFHEVDVWELVRKTVGTFVLAAKQVNITLSLEVHRGFESEEASARIQVASSQDSSSFDAVDEDFYNNGSAQTCFVPIPLAASTMSAMEEGRHMSVQPEEAAGADDEAALTDDIERATATTTQATMVEIPGETKDAFDEGEALSQQWRSLGGRGGDGGGERKGGINQYDRVRLAAPNRIFSISSRTLQQVAVRSIKAKPSSNSQGKTIRFPPESGNVHMMGDGTRLAQVIRNLISNALKFTPDDGTICVTATWTNKGLPQAAPCEVWGQDFPIDHPRAGSIRIAVTDSGAGLSEEQLEQIGREGVQFNANKLQGGRGSGLGLFISKGIVEQHGGRMVITSEGLGKGATFTVELPLYLFPLSYRSESPVATGMESDDPSASSIPHPNPAPGAGETGFLTPSSRRMSSAHSREPKPLTQDTLPRAFSELPNDALYGSSDNDCDDDETNYKKNNHNGISGQGRASSAVGTSGGRLSVTSTSGQGTAEHQAIRPPSSISVSTAASTAAMAIRAHSARTLLPTHVLVVDDAPSNRKMLVRLLQNKGCVCTEARHGQEAVDIMKKRLAKNVERRLKAAQRAQQHIQQRHHHHHHHAHHHDQHHQHQHHDKKDDGAQHGSEKRSGYVQLTKSNVIATSKKAAVANRDGFIAAFTSQSSSRDENGHCHSVSTSSDGSSSSPPSASSKDGDAGGDGDYAFLGIIPDRPPTPPSLSLLSHIPEQKLPAACGGSATAIAAAPLPRPLVQSVSRIQTQREEERGNGEGKGKSEGGGEDGGLNSVPEISQETEEPEEPEEPDFDAVLMDFEMPIMNGPTATKHIRDLGVACLIVGITGNVLPDDVSYYIKQGADAVLTKPLKLPLLTKLWQQKQKAELLIQGGH